MKCAQTTDSSFLPENPSDLIDLISYAFKSVSNENNCTNILCKDSEAHLQKCKTKLFFNLYFYFENIKCGEYKLYTVEAFYILHPPIHFVLLYID